MEQDWILGLIGGFILGCAAAIYLLVNGRIMGASGIVGGVVDGSGNDSWKERLSFILGLIGVPFILTMFWFRADTQITSNVVILVAAGLLVGFGTRMGSGCTSGHGICGLSRLSMRGFVATAAYIIAGAVAMLVFRQLLGVI